VSRCVLDASAAAAVLFREPDGDVVGRHLFHMKGVVVPQLFELEVANVGRTKVLRRELEWESARECLAGVLAWPVETVAVGWEQAWPFVREQNLTLYDATYLYLARRRGLPLLTLDRALRTAMGSRALP